ncbi:MAG TPA: hypothetical protein VHX88_22340 [Solirubrobacteraceae bacterium]|jgi:uncharacterized membrane protein YphA (DoxX/SURF4 family)|nr:hypothetical protein [Solirubrobacteraceae bacterium]
MHVVELVGRIMLAATFLITPYGVIASAARVAGSPAMKGSATLSRLPLGARVLTIRTTCVSAMAGALMIAMGLWPDLGALLVLAFLIPVTFVMHRFWEVEEWLPRKQKRDAFLANVSMAGGALVLFAAVNQSQSLPLALITHPLIARG